MSKLKFLNSIKEIYSKGGNLMEYLRNKDNSLQNDVNAIMISYDFQAGTYTEFAEQNADYINKYTSTIASVIVKLAASPVILEVGVGEGTTLVNVLKHLSDYKSGWGFDISWSRIKYAKLYATKNLSSGKLNLFTGNLFSIPLADNSIEIVYTSHSLEPNGGKESEALKELYRVASKYVILLEPGYEFADAAGKERMEKNGYIKNIRQHALDLGMEVVEHRLFDLYINPLNPTALTIIKVNKKVQAADPVFCCPISKTSLKKVEGGYYSTESGLYYPEVGGIPCLIEENAILATHFTK